MKLFTGWVLAAGLALSATAASAQVLGPSRVSDFSGPYVDGPYRGGPYYAPPPVEVIPPPRYGYGGYGPGYAPGYAPAALVPPHEVYSIIREAGFSPLGIPRQRGFIYTVAVIDRGGEDGRVVIDARSGRILRFVPAWQQGAPHEGAWNSSYGPRGPLPPGDLRSSAHPPGPAPRVASRSVPVPKPSPLAAKQPAEPARRATEAVAKPAPEPAASKPAPEPAASKPDTEAPKQQAAAAQARPAEAAPATTATIGQTQTQAKPGPAILPTQEMPKAQGLE